MSVHVAPPNSSWSDLFKTCSSSYLDTSLECLSPLIVDGVAEVPIDIVNLGLQEWSNSVVGFFVDRRLPYKLVKDSLTKMWKLKGSFTLTTDRELYYFNFSEDEDRKKIVEGGPVFIAGRLFVIRMWSEEVDRLGNKINTIPVWANLYNLPKSMWTKKGISFVASLIGVPLFSDVMTFKKERLEYARVSVEIGCEHKFEPSVKLKIGENVVTVGVEYPWKPSSCSICSRFGHKTSKCSKAPKQVWAARQENGDTRKNSGNASSSKAQEDEVPNKAEMADVNALAIVSVVSPVCIVPMVSPNRFEVLGTEVESNAGIAEPTDLLESGELIVDLSMDIVKETAVIPHVAQIDKELEQYEAEKAMFLDAQSDESDDDIEQ
ncbi:Rna exonuclease, partial [Thalictrum thalictroides]